MGGTLGTGFFCPPNHQCFWEYQRNQKQIDSGAERFWSFIWAIHPRDCTSILFSLFSAPKDDLVESHFCRAHRQISQQTG
jgi:hypothetical protein